MKSLIVTNTHNNRGEVVDLDFTEQKYYYADESGRCYTINDFVDVDAILHEQAKADRLIEYWTLVSCTILQFLSKERVENEKLGNGSGAIHVPYHDNANK
jgi:hypothetical protein